MSCLKAGHILSNGLKITIFCFSSVVNVNQIWNTGKNWSFAILQRQHVCTASYSYRVKNFSHRFSLQMLYYGEFQPKPVYEFMLFTWLFAVWGWIVRTLWLADFFPRLAAINFDLELAAVFWPGFWTSPANPAITSPFSCLRWSKEVQSKGEMEFRRRKSFIAALGWQYWKSGKQR